MISPWLRLLLLLLNEDCVTSKGEVQVFMTAKLESYLSGQVPLPTSQGATADLDSKGMKTVALTQVAPIVGLPESLQNSRSSKNSSKQNIFPSFTNHPRILCVPEPRFHGSCALNVLWIARNSFGHFNSFGELEL